MRFGTVSPEIAGAMAGVRAFQMHLSVSASRALPVGQSEANTSEPFIAVADGACWVKKSQSALGRTDQNRALATSMRLTWFGAIEHFLQLWPVASFCSPPMTKHTRYS